MTVLGVVFATHVDYFPVMVVKAQIYETETENAVNADSLTMTSNDNGHDIINSVM